VDSFVEITNTQDIGFVKIEEGNTNVKNTIKIAIE